MIIIAHLFLLCLGEYTGSKTDNTPFRIEEITFSCGHSVFAKKDTEADIHAEEFGTLTSTKQNDDIRCKKIGHKASGDPLLCPKYSLFWNVLHLRPNKAPPSAPLSRIITPIGRWKNIMPTIIYKTLKTDVIFCGPNLAFKSKDVSNRSLCAAGAMAIICSGIESDIIKMIGRCCIN